MRRLVLILLILSLACSCAAEGISKAVKPTTGLIVVTHKDGSVTPYNAVNTNAARGAKLAAVVAAAKSGDSIKLAANAFSLSAPLVLPAGVTLEGRATFSGAGAASAQAVLVDVTKFINATATALATDLGSDNAADPTFATGMSAVGSDKVLLDVTLTGTSAGWTILPCYALAGATEWSHGDPVQVSTADNAHVTFEVPSYGAQWFNVRCYNSYGLTPTITITGTPRN